MPQSSRVLTNKHKTAYIIVMSSNEHSSVTTNWYACSECENSVDTWDTYCKHCGAKLATWIRQSYVIYRD